MKTNTHFQTQNGTEVAHLVLKLAQAEAALEAAAGGGSETRVGDVDGHAVLLKAAQRALLSANAGFAQLAKYSPVVIFSLRITEEGVVPERVTENVLTMLGFTPEETLRRSWWEEQVHPDDLAAARHGTQAALRTGTSRVEYRIRHQNGAYRWVEDQKVLVRDPTGVKAELYGVWCDVTERRRAEQEQRRTEEKFTHLFRLSPVAIAYVAGDGRISDVNDRWVELLGGTKEEAVGKSPFEIGLCSEANDAAHLEAQLQAEGAARDFECHFRRTDGRAGVARVSVESVTIAGERGRVFLVFDVTKTKELEAQVYRAQRMDSVGRLAGGIAHDLNNILAPIMMAAPLLCQELGPEERAKLAATIETSAKRGANLVRQLLLFGRGIEGARVALALASIVVEMEGMITETFPRNITVETIIPEAPWPVRGDPTQLHQVLLNLCVNARDAMPQGGDLRIALHNVEFDRPALHLGVDAREGCYVRLSVTDTGTGIAPEHLDRIFDPFFTTKGAGDGTGLGLSTVIGIVKAHGGFLNVRSALGAGTTFEIYFPALPKAAPRRHTVDSKSPVQGRNQSILLVDDEESIRETAGTVLGRNGYNVQVARDGAEAAALFARHAIDLIVTDYDMPVMDGVSLIKLLKQSRPGLKAIVSTGAQSGMRFKRDDLAAMGIAAVLAKPYTPDEILAVVQTSLNSADGGAAG